MRYVVIMAGGSGKRLWPLSRQGEPKQLLDLIEGKSLLRVAYERIRGVVPDERILVCTGAAYADQVAAQLPELPAANLLGEPEGRDSLNAVAWPAAVLADRDPEAVIAMLTADHIMRPEDVFRDRLNEAFELAEAEPDALVTFGVVPTSPQTGFGYLARGPHIAGHACVVEEFTEKPALEIAQRYVASGRFWWNSGMFVWRAQTLLAALRTLHPTTADTIAEIVAHPEQLEHLYPTLHKTSVDFGIMEPVSRGDAPGRVLAVELPIAWFDVGSFLALAGQLPTDEHGNAREGATVVVDGDHNLVINHAGPDHVVAIAGVDSMAVVVTDRATLCIPLSQSERVKDVVAEVSRLHGAHFA